MDPLDADPDTLRAMPVHATMTNGRWTHGPYSLIPYDMPGSAALPPDRTGWSVDARRAALVVLNVQNHFLHVLREVLRAGRSASSPEWACWRSRRGPRAFPCCTPSRPPSVNRTGARPVSGIPGCPAARLPGHRGRDPAAGR
ncbi:hypothetical protein ACRAWF_35565 [Streptomyces sp. L7]